MSQENRIIWLCWWALTILAVWFLFHVGLVFMLFLGGTLLGREQKNKRFFLGSVTGFLIFSLNYLAFGASQPVPAILKMEFQRTRWTGSTLRDFKEALGIYLEMSGEYPNDLEQMNQWFQAFEEWDLVVFQNDGWGNDFYYQKTANGFELASLGRDNQPGGQGLDADWYLGDNLAMAKFQLPTRQFFLECSSSPPLFFSAVTSSTLIFLIFYFSKTNFYNIKPDGTISLVSLILLSILISIFLSFEHVALQSNGH